MLLTTMVCLSMASRTSMSVGVRRALPRLSATHPLHLFPPLASTLVRGEWALTQLEFMSVRWRGCLLPLSPLSGRDGLYFRLRLLLLWNGSYLASLACLHLGPLAWTVAWRGDHHGGQEWDQCYEYHSGLRFDLSSGI